MIIMMITLSVFAGTVDAQPDCNSTTTGITHPNSHHQLQKVRPRKRAQVMVINNSFQNIIECDGYISRFGGNSHCSRTKKNVNAWFRLKLG